MSLTNDVDFTGRLRGAFPVAASTPTPGHVVKIPDYASAGIRPPWQQDAACRGEDTETFFPELHRGPFILQIKAAKAVCERCTVVDRCLSWALDTGQHGIWGGLDENERAELTSKKASPTARAGALKRAGRLARSAKATQARHTAATAALTDTHLADPTPAASLRTVPGVLTRAAQQAVRLAVHFPRSVHALAASQPPIIVPVACVSTGLHDRRRPLTQREAQILAMVADGKTAAQISGVLHITESTIKTHKRNIADSLGASGESAHCVALGYAHGYLQPRQPHPRPLEELPQLPRTQIEVLLLLVEGLNNKEIGARLYRSEDTIKTRITQLFKQLNVASRTAAVDVAFRSGLFVAVPGPEATP